jgi:hypothetical protein
LAHHWIKSHFLGEERFLYASLSCHERLPGNMNINDVSVSTRDVVLSNRLPGFVESCYDCWYHNEINTFSIYFFMLINMHFILLTFWAFGRKVFIV